MLLSGWARGRVVPRLRRDVGVESADGSAVCVLAQRRRRRSRRPRWNANIRLSHRHRPVATCRDGGGSLCALRCAELAQDRDAFRKALAELGDDPR